MLNKKIYVVSFISVVVLLATIMTEYLFYRQDRQVAVRILEERLHRQEEKADEILSLLKETDKYSDREWEDEITFLAFRQKKLFFWSNKLAGIENLYNQLTHKGKFIKLGNTYYEVRHRQEQEIDYFALIRILEDYPYTTKYVKNQFANFLRISEKNVEQLDVSKVETEAGHLIRNKEGEELFFLIFGKQYKEGGPQYLLVSLYLLFFLSLFYVYGQLLKNITFWRNQLLCAVGFVVFLLSLRYYMQLYHCPMVIYRMPIFEEKFTEKFFITSIGDLILITFSLFQFISVTLANIRINYASDILKRYRYLIGGICLLGTFSYVVFFHFAVEMVMEHMDIHLNIAQLFHVGINSILAFVAINFGGLIIWVLLLGTVSVLKHMMSFRRMVLFVTIICFFVGIGSLIFDVYLELWSCIFVWGIFMLLAISRYLLRSDVQQGLYLLTIFLLCVYVVLLFKEYEQNKELSRRMDYATELIEERDYNFEKRLMVFDSLLLHTDKLVELLEVGDQNGVLNFLDQELLDLTGYNYEVDVVASYVDGRFWSTRFQELNESEEMELILSQYGQRINQSCFYLLNRFDGWVTYWGSYRLGNVDLYLRFQALQNEEELGYSQVLSRKSESKHRRVYFYSYAKYAQGKLITSQGNFVYYKQLQTFGNIKQSEISVLHRDRYSHMIIPVDGDNILIVSLPEQTFALYYMNVLYAFIICFLLISNGLFFKINRDVPIWGRTLRARVKNNIVFLIIALLVLLTALSVFMNTKSFESRYQTQILKLLKYVNGELEGLDCVDWNKCPQILDVLDEMAELVSTDINIYSMDGKLISTSRPEIFQYGFDGMLINPKALEQIVDQKATNYIEKERLGELQYIAAYIPLMLDNGETYILNIPYFTQSDELNLDISIMIVIIVNIAIIMIVLAFILSTLLAERVTKPLQMINEKFRIMRIDGKNEKIRYQYKDEIAILIQEYNNMVDKLEASVAQLARSEREYAWREMARQIAHEIKNPLTPMKLNIQFLLRTLEMESSEKFEQRFREVSQLLIEQIDNMATTASAFSDFAKMSPTHNEVFEVDELLRNCVELFRNNIDEIECDFEENLRVFGDKGQFRRVIINLLKNAEQSVPQEEKSMISISAKQVDEQIEIRIRDNGCGISPEISEKIFEPNFTTKSSGSGLGLAICRRIIEEFDGKIGFITEQNSGTEFFIILNRYQESEG